MKTFKLFTIVIFLYFYTSIIYHWGKNQGLNFCEQLHQEQLADISSRYFNHLGNPETLEQHCAYTYILYGDITECDDFSDYSDLEYSEHFDN